MTIMSDDSKTRADSKKILLDKGKSRAIPCLTSND